MKNLISVIVPLFNEQENVDNLVNRLVATLEDEGIAFELILVDDGSSDGTFSAIQQAADRDNRVTGLRFRRHHGQTAAIKAGFDRAQGEVCITMDGDLQHDPRQIPEFLAKINEGFDLVCSYRVRRNDAVLRRVPSRIANLLAGLFSRMKLRDFGSTFRAYRTDLARELPIYGEMHRFIPVFVSLMTDRICEIPITLNPRQHGQSKYGLDRSFRVLSDLLVLLFFAGFFSRPIHIFGYIAILLGLPGFAILSWLSFAKIFHGIAIMNYSPLFFLGVMLCLVAGQMITTGIVCEYLIRIYYNDGRKPYSLAATTRADE